MARVRQGMAAMLRLGSAWYDVAAQVRAVTEAGLDTRKLILCTDDCYAAPLVREGHMDRVLRHAIAQGLRPMTALQMCTVNAAGHFGLERELGSIAPGRRADVVLTDSLVEFRAQTVICRGEIVAESGEMLAPRPGFVWPPQAKDSVHLARPVAPQDFRVEAPAGANYARARVIGVVENQAPTKALTADLHVSNGIVEPDEANDIAQIALVERHRGTGDVLHVRPVWAFHVTPTAAAANGMESTVSRNHLGKGVEQPYREGHGPPESVHHR